MRVHISLLQRGLMLVSTLASAQQAIQSFPVHPEYNAIDVLLQQCEQQNTSKHVNRAESDATVSLQELAHKVPKQAMKEYKRAWEAFRKSEGQTAAEHFRNAVDIDPEFADSHDNLRVVLAKQGHIGEAAQQFQKTIDLVPNHHRALANLSITLFVLKRYHEVCPVARRLLQIDPGLPEIRLALGLSLLAEQIYTTEAVDNPLRAASQFPDARIAASNVLKNIGRREDAARHLEEYLRSAPKDDEYAGLVEGQMVRLRQ